MKWPEASIRVGSALRVLRERTMTKSVIFLAELLPSTQNLRRCPLLPPFSLPSISEQPLSEQPLCETVFSLAIAKNHQQVVDMIQAEQNLSQCSYLSFMELLCELRAGAESHSRNLLNKNDFQSLISMADQSLNPALPQVLYRLQLLRATTSFDPFLEYLHGLCLLNVGKCSEAVEALVRCIRGCPYLIEGWEALSRAISGAGDIQIETLDLPSSLFLHRFKVLFNIARHRTALLDADLEPLNLLEENPFVLELSARVAHAKLDHEQALCTLRQLHQMHPHRPQAMDLYSNVLYVQMDTRTLSSLAQWARDHSKLEDEPELMIILGNYHTLTGDLKEACKWFAKATIKSPDNPHTWVLLGHGFLELRKSNLARQAYTAALKVDSRLMEGWYGLGHTDELLGQASRAAHYYYRAADEAPDDARTWAALASVHTQLHQPGLALRCAARAMKQCDIAQQEPDISVLVVMADSAMTLGRPTIARKACRRLLDQLGINANSGQIPSELHPDDFDVVAHTLSILLRIAEEAEDHDSAANILLSLDTLNAVC